MTDGSHAPGYSPAHKIADYTTIIPLSNAVVALNLVTGRYWHGAQESLQSAKEAVEEGAGQQLAASKVSSLEQRYVDFRESTPRTTSLVLLPTYGCNVACGYCYEGKLTSNKVYWSASDVEKALETLDNLQKSEGVVLSNASLSILGGEPVQESHLPSLVSLIEGAKSKGIQDIQIITNGLELAGNSLLLNSAGATSIMITVDGVREIHDRRRPSRDNEKSSYDRAIEGIRDALAAGMRITVRVNTDDRNIDSIHLLGDVFLSEGFFEKDKFAAYIYPVSTDFRTNRKFATEAELSRKLAENVRRHPVLHKFLWEFHGLDALYAVRAGLPLGPKLRYCGATTDQYVIDTNWNIFSCWFGTGKDQFKLGSSRDGQLSSFDKDLDKLWRSRGPANMEPCRSCKWAMVCGGGCSFKAQLKKGNFFTPNCADFEEIYANLAQLLLEGESST